MPAQQVVNHVPGSDGLTRVWRNAWHVEGVRAPSVIDPRRTLRDGTDVVIDYSISPESFTLMESAFSTTWKLVTL